jgi:pectinesterase
LRIADLVLLYQRDSGGWPKNIDMGKPISEEDRDELRETERILTRRSTTARRTRSCRIWRASTPRNIRNGIASRF